MVLLTLRVLPQCCSTSRRVRSSRFARTSRVEGRPCQVYSASPIQSDGDGVGRIPSGCSVGSCACIPVSEDQLRIPETSCYPTPIVCTVRFEWNASVTVTISTTSMEQGKIPLSSELGTALLRWDTQPLSTVEIWQLNWTRRVRLGYPARPFVRCWRMWPYGESDKKGNHRLLSAYSWNRRTDSNCLSLSPLAVSGLKKGEKLAK